ncbi:MAG: hypothetical protein ACJ8AW_03020 [Rhodopila sp.]
MELEPPLNHQANHHSVPYGTARPAREPLDRPDFAYQEILEGDAPLLPDDAMMDAALEVGLSVGALEDHLMDRYSDVVNKALLGDPAARQRYRSLWYARLEGSAPDPEHEQ